MSKLTYARQIDYNTPEGVRTAIISTTHNNPKHSMIELSFAGSQPLEGINTYDYATGKNEFDSGSTLSEIIDTWIADQDEQELEDRLSDYPSLEDQDEIRAQWASRPERAWLATYLANAIWS